MTLRQLPLPGHPFMPDIRRLAVFIRGRWRCGASRILGPADHRGPPAPANACHEEPSCRSR
ncbi:conserved hypothetical protein [Streptomyces viridosporus ATCC 14672]|uniref:Uncharacterized protein n=1 Tax=Streptomyces viridosporus (strain ATCC 14672 / DSM 40746 / JCM 4963 / KCTC 9882 / NRRL B-12104 / FH 1290) TaxID=566461 RepID=D6A9T1_STRV1|nr:conserved hypothetical protein [Streptomyces viridosporus ATCC 14672]